MFLKAEHLSNYKKSLENKIQELKTRNIIGGCAEIDTENIKTTDYIKPLSKQLHYNEVASKTQERIKKEKELPHSIAMEAGFEKLSQLPTKLSKRQERKMKQQERAKSKGKWWFGMEAAEMTEEKVNDLKVIQMRNILDPTRFYKNTDIRPGVLPKFFQTGTVVESAADFYSGRLTMKKRKKTLVDELLQDAELQKYQKRKHSELFGKSLKGPMKKKKKNKI